MKKIILATTLCMAIFLGGCGDTGAKAEEKNEATTGSPKTEGENTASSDTNAETDTTKVTGDTIKVGVIQPQSGDLAVSGGDSLLGTKIAFDLINEAGGVDGKMIQMVSADVPDQTSAQNEVNRLIQNEKVKVITGVYGSAMATVAGNICNRNDVLYVESISVTNALTEKGYEGVFRIHTNGSGFGLQAAAIVAEYADKIGVDKDKMKIAIISENGDFGQSVSKGVQEYAAENGMNIVLDELYDSKSTDTSPIVLKLKAADPDVVIATSYINDGIDITKQSKILGFNPKLYVGIGSGYGLDAYQKALGEDAEGIIDIDASPNMKGLSPEMESTVSEFQKRFEAERGYAPPSTSYLAFQTSWVLANNIIKDAGGVDDYQKLIAAAKALDIPSGTLPTSAGVKFDEKNQNTRAVLSAMQWQNGKLVTIYPEAAAEAEPIMIPRPAWSN